MNTTLAIGILTSLSNDEALSNQERAAITYALDVINAGAVGMTLEDIAGEPAEAAPPLALMIKRDPAGGGICIYPAGYGEKTAEDGAGSPIYIERYNARLRVSVWADISREDPTHVIDMEGAREELRIADAAL